MWFSCTMVQLLSVSGCRIRKNFPKKMWKNDVNWKRKCLSLLFVTRHPSRKLVCSGADVLYVVVLKICHEIDFTVPCNWRVSLLAFVHQNSKQTNECWLNECAKCFQKWKIFKQAVSNDFWKKIFSHSILIQKENIFHDIDCYISQRLQWY